MALCPVVRKNPDYWISMIALATPPLTSVVSSDPACFTFLRMTNQRLSLPVDDAYPIDVTSLPTGWAVVPLGEAILDVPPGFSSGRHSLNPDAGVAHLRPMNITTAGPAPRREFRFLIGGVAFGDPLAGSRLDNERGASC